MEEEGYILCTCKECNFYKRVHTFYKQLSLYFQEVHCNDCIMHCENNNLQIVTMYYDVVVVC